MKKKNLYSLFLKIVIPIFGVVMLCCYILKIEFDIIASICAVFVLLLFGMLLINVLVVEPKEHYELIKKNSEKEDNDEYFEIFINRISNDSKLKKLYKLRKVLSPILVIPFSIVIGNIVRNVLYKTLSDTHKFYEIENYETYVTIALIMICAYSIYNWFRKTYEIRSCLENNIFDYFADKYKMIEISNDDELTKGTINSYLKMIKRENYKFEVNRMYKVNLSEKRFFKLYVYFSGHKSAVSIFNGLSMIIPCVKQDLFYKTHDYMTDGLAYDYFDNCTPVNNITDELKIKFMKIQNKYNKPFKISTVDGKIQIFCEQDLVTFGSFAKMKVYVKNYCKAIECLFELSNVIENSF